VTEESGAGRQEISISSQHELDGTTIAPSHPIAWLIEPAAVIGS
jgi:hypothetical protein